MKNFFFNFPDHIMQFRIKFFFKIAIIEQKFFANIEASRLDFFFEIYRKFFFCLKCGNISGKYIFLIE